MPVGRFPLPEVEADHSLGAGTSPCIHVPSAARILQTILTKARTAPVFVSRFQPQTLHNRLHSSGLGLGRP